VYRAVQSGAGGTQQIVFTTNGYHALEADLTPRVASIPALDDPTEWVLRGGFALWPFVTALVLALSLLEWWLDARGH
jgi:hypothetical protein